MGLIELKLSKIKDMPITIALRRGNMAFSNVSINKKMCGRRLSRRDIYMNRALNYSMHAFSLGRQGRAPGNTDIFLAGYYSCPLSASVLISTHCYLILGLAQHVQPLRFSPCCPLGLVGATCRVTITTSGSSICWWSHG